MEVLYKRSKSLLPVTTKVSNKKESLFISIAGFPVNSFIIFCLCYIMLSFMPDIGMPYPDYTSASWFCGPAEVVWAGTWEEVMTRLSGYGAGTRTAVTTDGTLQYLSG